MATLPTRQFNSELPNLLSSLLGTNTRTGQTTTANTAPLQQVFDQTQQGMSPEQYQQLIAGIFSSATQNIPQLTTALANATGSRTSGNSALALGLNEQNNAASAQAAQALLNYNQQNLATAGNAARGIAESTRTVNSTQRQGTGSNPLVPLIGGFALNQFDKRGGADWLERKGSELFSGAGDFLGNLFSPAQSFDYSMLDSQMGSGFDLASSFSGGGDYSLGGGDFGGFGDVVSGVGDFLGGIGDFAGDALGSVRDFFGFADGGMIRSNVPYARDWNSCFSSPVMPRAYADGGSVGRGMIPARANSPQQVADGAARGGNANQLMQQILMQAMMPQQPVAPAPNVLNFLRYLLPTSDFNIYQYGDGGKAGYADGGVVRNRNNLGGPLVQERQGALNAINVPSGAGGAGINSADLNTMVTQLLDAIGTNTQVGSQNGRTPATRETAGGALNQAAGNPMGAEALGAFGQAAAGMVAPGLMQSLGMTPAGMALANPTLSSLGITTGPVGLARALVGLARRENEATDSIQGSPDPLGSFIGALSESGALGINTSALSMDAATAAANAVSSITPSVDPISALIGITDNFSGRGGGGWSDRGPGGSSGDTDGGTADGGLGEGPGGFNARSGESGGGRAGSGMGQGDGSRGSEGTTGGWANGGLLRGPGTGTSDDIKAVSRIPGERSVRFSNGEIVIPRDTVEMFGEKHFLDLISKTHRPARR